MDERKIVICSFFGKGYGDNGKYIVEEIIKQELDYDIVWLVAKNVDRTNFPDQVRQVGYKSIRGIYELATAKFWIDNCRKYFYPPKGKSSLHQTWHGNIGVKLVRKQ